MKKDFKTTIAGIVNLIALIGCLVALFKGTLTAEEFTVVMGTVSSINVTAIGVLAKDSSKKIDPQD